MFKSNNLENKSYFTIKMGLFRNGRGISIQDIQAMSKPWTSLEIREEEHYFIEKRRKLGGAAYNNGSLWEGSVRAGW